MAKDCEYAVACMEYYKCEGDSGVTYGVHVDGTTYMQIRHPHGELGTVQELESFANWNLDRWVGQMGAEAVPRDELPDALLREADAT